MNKGMMVLGIILFAIAGAILYVWGLKKSLTQGEELQRMLLSKCGGKVIRYLKKNGTISEKEMAAVVAGVQAGQFWSRRRAAVQDPRKFTKQLTEFLLTQQYIESADKDRYRLRR
ncbi:hypothetical protein SDC9_97983 [bioreactor metagenome]|uniref:Uncharacterized protein n=1 Tax=bioreactor metagenome TaxID=1076179 RepID=A0A645ADF0_9ZZZZ|nr:hypothetical protein [Oscillibacter sp.]